MRYMFGGVADYVVGAGDKVTFGGGPAYQTLLVPNKDVTFWSASSSGVQYTDLVDLTDVAITGGVVTTDSAGALPQFKGPDGVTVMYADAGGSRRAMVAVDIGATTEELRNTLLDLTSTVDAQAALLGGSMGVVRYNADTSSWPTRPSDSRPYLWVGPTAPQIGGGYMQDGVDYWLNPTPVVA